MEWLIGIFLLLLTGIALVYLFVAKVLLPVVNMFKQKARLK